MTPWVTRLIVANAAVFLAQQAFGRQVTLLLGYQPISVLSHPWTPITYMFVHGGLWHLVFNMLGLYFFGPALESRLGSRHFLALYFVSGLSGAALSWLTPTAFIVGASGATFGVFMGFALYWPRERIYIWGVLPVEARVLVAVMTLVSLFGIGGGIAHFAHLGGFVGAFVYLKVMDWRSPARQFKRKASPAASRTPFTSDGSDLKRWQRIPVESLHPINRSEVDRLLAKARDGGAASLTPDERATLDRFAS